MIQQKNVTEDEVYKELVQAIPELPKMLVQMMIRSEHFDSRKPQTELAAIKNDFSSFTAKVEKNRV